ncbi:LPS assembly lipoprotein LptE [Sphingomonas jeddahensis]|uniref:Lipopolysaccharide-assembly n=1 Tax=Sphingomonas jeddahensis TaxID=1915074 RepID=A0A1V2EUZ8_9SPHN|nr:LPS assembly lipoprotein LptE [Sphingomonas jeddahensis]ONF96496.1 hypothetical protein SPHI_12810 [Sphingomonas jeddahensis]
MKRLLPLLIVPLLAPVLGGCGLKPLYAGGGSGEVATALGQIEVAPIEGRAGWLVANALRDRLGAVPAGGAARYRLQIKLDDEITGLAIRRDDSVARERRTLRARYQLVELDKGGVVLDATAGSDAGIDVVGSDYATIAAEATALERLSQTVADQILMRIAVYSRRAPEAP